MLIGNYKFVCRFNTPALLPAFKGSTLRGALGHALKKVACPLGPKECDRCLLAEKCAYSVIFATRKPGPQPDDHNLRLASIPHPYVLEPPPEDRRHYESGDTLTFSLILFGKANDYLPYLIYAVDQMGKQGLGKGTGENQGLFALETVVSDDLVIYDHTRQVLDQGRPLRELTLFPPADDPTGSLTVHLITPLRLKQHNQFQDDLPFHLLVRAALRRISTLEQAYGLGEPPLDYPGLIKRAEQVEVLRGDYQWIDLTRYSNRQQTAMLIGGLQGTITYQGEMGEFLPLLRYCEKTHLGKQTAFGLGRIEVEE